MSTHAIAPRRSLTGVSIGPLLLGAAAIAAAVFVAVVGLRSRQAFLHDAVPVLLVPLAAWLFFSEREEVTLAVLLLYLGLLDGFIKLASGSNIATLGRDVLLYAIALGALARIVLRQQPITLPPLSGFVLAWVAVCVMQVANPSDISITHAVASLRQHLEFVPLFFLGYTVLRSERRITGLLLLLLIVAAVNGIVGLIQSGLSPQQLASWGPGYAHLEFGGNGLAARTFVTSTGKVAVRPPGLGSLDGFGGLLCLIAVPGAVLLFGSLRRGVKLGWLLFPATILTIVGIVTSQTRLDVVGAVIALLAFLALTITSRRGIAMLLIGAVVALGGSYIVARFVSSNANRYSTITPSTILGTAVTARSGTTSLIPTYFTRYPLGAGLGSVGPAAGSSIGGTTYQRGLNGESEFLFLLVETGIPGLFVMLAFVLTTLRFALALRRVADPGLQKCLMALTAVLIAFLVTWLFGPVTSDSPGSPFMWCASGCIAYWYGEVRAGRVRLRPRHIAQALALR